MHNKIIVRILVLIALNSNAENPFPFVHTAVFCHDIPGSHTHIYPRWNDDRFKGTTILYGFATALQEARRRFGVKFKINTMITVLILGSRTELEPIFFRTLKAVYQNQSLFK